MACVGEYRRGSTPKMHNACRDAPTWQFCQYFRKIGRQHDVEDSFRSVEAGIRYSLDQHKLVFGVLLDSAEVIVNCFGFLKTKRLSF